MGRAPPGAEAKVGEEGWVSLGHSRLPLFLHCWWTSRQQLLPRIATARAARPGCTADGAAPRAAGGGDLGAAAPCRRVIDRSPALPSTDCPASRLPAAYRARAERLQSSAFGGGRKEPVAFRRSGRSHIGHWASGSSAASGRMAQADTVPVRFRHTAGDVGPFPFGRATLVSALKDALLDAWPSGAPLPLPPAFSRLPVGAGGSHTA